MSGADEQPRAEGWYQDPSGVHYARRWDGSRWTAFVADRFGVQSVHHLDEIPARPLPPVTNGPAPTRPAYEIATTATASPALAELQAVPTTGRRRVHWGAIGAVAALVAFVAVATITLGGGHAHAKKSPVLLRSAWTQTASAGTDHESAVLRLSGDGHQTVVDFELAVDSRNHALTGIVRQGGSVFAELRRAGDVGYISSPKASLPGGAHWVTLPAGQTTSVDETLGSTDPHSGLRYFSAIDGNPQVVDHNPFDGVAVTHYAFNLDLEPYFKRAGKNLGVGANLSQVESVLNLSKVPAEAWIDAQGRVRRFEYTIKVSAPDAFVEITEDLQFSHFDEPVTVSVPDASDTVPLAKVPNFITDIAKHLDTTQ